MKSPDNKEFSGDELAVIGMSCRFPGATDIDAFWQNIRDGVASIRCFSEDELLARGVAPDILKNPNHVKAAAFLDEPGAFDADFFGMSHREAEITDPQHRVLLECAWTALEHAGYDSDRFEGAISVFAGATINSYLLYNLAANPEMLADLDPTQINIGNASDFLATRIAYKLNLKGPSYSVQSACSTSLVAVHTACESLLSEECDMALAGGVSINVSFQNGYLYLEGGMVSPDGQCRPFDARAQGTIFGSGAGMVVLKRLEDAIRDGDTIHALIKGSAVNNDGSLKAGYTAPGVEGQRRVIAEALANAAVHARDIGYIEAHGTATPLGDPVEIQALTQAFRQDTQDRGFCRIGSVKSNIGHLDAAAGVAGLIKTVLALKHRQLPPSLHFQRPNPNIDFAATPFRVVDRLTEWSADRGPRRAGVSAFGVGGANAHVILEEAPPPEPREATTGPRLVMLSAKTESSLERMIVNLADHLERHDQLNLADVAFTLQIGRKPLQHRCFTIANDSKATIRALRDTSQIFMGACPSDGKKRPVAFLFPGQGAQFAGMGAALYRAEAVFREEIDRCAALLEPELGLDLRLILYPAPGDEQAADARLRRTDMAQPALFATAHALAQLFRSRGIEPQALAGHSIGEYVAACQAGVFSLSDGLKLVAARARLMAGLSEGAMTALPFSEHEIAPFLGPDLDLAAINGPRRCVVASSLKAIADLEQRMRQDGVAFRRLETSHAFHSRLIEPILSPLLTLVSSIRLSPPTTPFLSNLSGDWITPRQATDPRYWVDHARSTVRFADNLKQLLADPARVFLELGPGGMCGLVRQHPAYRPEQPVIQALGGRRDRDDLKTTLTAHGRLWLAGVETDWSSLSEERRQRIPLPTYSFERRLYWVEPRSPRDAAHPPRAAEQADLKSPTDDWFYLPSWRRAPAPRTSPDPRGDSARNWLVFADAGPFSLRLEDELKRRGLDYVLVRTGLEYQRRDREFWLEPADPSQYQHLIADLERENRLPDAIIHGWLFSEDDHWGGPDRFAACRDRGYFSLLYLARALPNDPKTRRLLVAANRLCAIAASEELDPEKALVAGLCQVLPREYANLRCQTLDLTEKTPIDLVLAMALDLPDRPRALRGKQCWSRCYQPIRLPRTRVQLRENGVYLFTGGFGEIGYAIARCFAQKQKIRLVFLEDASLPETGQWDQALKNLSKHDLTRQKINRARALEKNGAEILMLQTDLAEKRSVRGAINQVTARYGAIHGLVHGAKADDAHALCAAGDTGPETSEKHFIPKIHGLQHLVHALDGRGPGEPTLDFALLNGSLSSVLGGVGMAAYAAANAFMDHYAQWLNRRDNGVWIAVNWDAWSQSGSASSSARARHSIQPDEAIDVLERILAQNDLERIALSVTDLDRRLAEAPAASPPVSQRQNHPRPNLPYAFVTPSGDLESSLAETWRKALGVDRIGARDNFFDLGGDSLLAVKTIAQIKQSLDIDIPVTGLYEGLTVRALAELIAEYRQPESRSQEQQAQQTEREDRMSQRRRLQLAQRSRRRDRSDATGEA